MTLRELRMWHWRKLLKHRKTENTYRVRASVAAVDRPGGLYDRKYTRLANTAKKEADFHLSAVQALNDAVWATCQGYPTAEQDCAEWDNDVL